MDDMLLLVGRGRLAMFLLLLLLLLLLRLLVLLVMEVRLPLRLEPEDDEGFVDEGYSILIACLACALPEVKAGFFIDMEEDTALKDWDLFMVELVVLVVATKVSLFQLLEMKMDKEMVYETF
jgi:hypothetical protein